MTTLDPSLLHAASLVAAYKHAALVSVMAALVRMGITARDFDASQLADGIAAGDNADKLPGLAVAELRRLEIVTVTDAYRKSSKPSAKGRPVRVLRIDNQHVSRARAWLRANGFDPMPEGEVQSELFTA